MKKALIIGGGFAGCASAHQLSLAGGWDITLVEAAPFLGAGVRTQWYGGHPYTFGPRHFLTDKPHIYEYLNKICPLRTCEDHEFLTYIEKDETFYHYPIHRDDLGRMPEKERIFSELSNLNLANPSSKENDSPENPDTGHEVQSHRVAEAKNFEEFWIYSVGETLYRKFVDEYSKKMWMIDDNKKIDDFTWSPKGVTIKEGPKACWDNAISAYPKAATGYDDYFEIATENVNVLLKTPIGKSDIPSKTVRLNGEDRKFDVIVNTISPDILFDYCHGELPYIGREILPIVLPVEFAFPPSVYFCYYAGKERFTRIVEYKKFTHHKAPTTLITLEIPSTQNKHYPLPFESEKAKAKKYFDEMPDGVFSIGRAGSYLYNVDIDDTIDHGMKVVEALNS